MGRGANSSECKLGQTGMHQRNCRGKVCDTVMANEVPLAMTVSPKKIKNNFFDTIFKKSCIIFLPRQGNQTWYLFVDRLNVKPRCRPGFIHSKGIVGSVIKPSN